MRARVRVAIGLGSNRGERRSILESAVQSLKASSEFEVERLSSFFENPAVGGEPGQGDYLNAALIGTTSLAPHELLARLLEIEKAHGRDRRTEGRNGARTLDLDLLLYGDRILRDRHLTVPHPRMLERDFVLGPLAEQAPELRIPTTGRTVGEEWSVFAEARSAQAASAQGTALPEGAPTT